MCTLSQCLFPTTGHLLNTSTNPAFNRVHAICIGDCCAILVNPLIFSPAVQPPVNGHPDAEVTEKKAVVGCSYCVCCFGHGSLYITHQCSTSSIASTSQIHIKCYWWTLTSSTLLLHNCAISLVWYDQIIQSIISICFINLLPMSSCAITTHAQLSPEWIVLCHPVLLIIKAPGISGLFSSYGEESSPSSLAHPQ